MIRLKRHKSWCWGELQHSGGFQQGPKHLDNKQKLGWWVSWRETSLIIFSDGLAPLHEFNSMATLTRPETAQRQTSCKPTCQTCMDGDGLPRVSHAWGAEAACQIHCLPEQRPRWNWWETCCRSDNVPIKPTRTTWVSAIKVHTAAFPTPSLPQGMSTTVPPSPASRQEGDNSLLLMAFTGSQPFCGEQPTVEVDMKDRIWGWQPHHRLLSCVPRSLLLTASHSRAPAPGAAQLAEDEGYQYVVVFLLKEPMKTPQRGGFCATLGGSTSGSAPCHIQDRTSISGPSRKASSRCFLKN